MKSKPGENYNVKIAIVKIALLTPSLPSIFTDQFSPAPRTLTTVANRKHADIMKEKLPSTLT